MEEIKVLIEIEEEIVQIERFGIEDAIADALNALGIKVISVRVRF